MRQFRLILSIVLACVAYDVAQAQIKIIPREKLESTANPRLSADSASLSFDTKRIIADTMNEKDAPKSFRYAMKNVGSKTLNIHKINTSCSCAQANIDRKSLAPGESANVTVTYNPKGHPGRFERRVFIYTREGNSPAAILSLMVNVENAEDFSGLYHYQMGCIRLRRSSLSFEDGKAAVEKIPFVNLSGKELRLSCDKAMLPPCLTFSTQPAVLADRQEGEIVISFDPSKGGVRPQMPVIISNLGLAPSKSSIMVKIESNIR